MTTAILYDVTRCEGCQRCVAACAAANGSPADGEAARFRRDGLDAEHRSTLVSVGEDRFVRRGCVHCLEPACEAACLVGALHRTPSGAVVYDADKCIGCRYCMLACPFSVPQYEWDRVRPFISKCELCRDRPDGPACVAACPHEAVITGERDDLLRIARTRIANDPDRYLDHVWGEHEAGGTGVLFVSDVSLDAWWPTRLGSESVPELTMPFVRSTPFLFAGVATTLSALAFVIHRRDRLAAERAGVDSTGGADDAA